VGSGLYNFYNFLEKGRVYFFAFIANLAKEAPDYFVVVIASGAKQSHLYFGSTHSINSIFYLNRVRTVLSL